MRIIHGQGYTKGDRMKFKVLVHRNILMAIQALVNAMELLQIEYEMEDTLEHGRKLLNVRPEDIQDMEPEHLEAINRVWGDKGVQTCYQRRREYQLSDSTK